MHPPRPPSIDHGVASFVWALLLGLFIWAGLLAVGVSGGTSIVLAVVAFFLIFLYVRLFGEEQLGAQRGSPREGA